ncbi:hypothetical protein TetV_224 [Tetraselmis virus 1]|uniref:Uncharacterized protein n=1 Tax=Tetraselmis virus 1 TaxID=2060617 RepID=A0A2P0VN32_9VIRU|nr:hypothetical protein QJ968_gp224 [Tetraselmis virus 1]AUF82316.1 hypothetical protein TetV_224 [Tetraselmis virus 1]
MTTITFNNEGFVINNVHIPHKKFNDAYNFVSLCVIYGTVSNQINWNDLKILVQMYSPRDYIDFYMDHIRTMENQASKRTISGR